MTTASASSPDVLSPQNQPSIRETAFCCPHCSAFTTQYWYRLGAERLTGDKPVPFMPTAEQREQLADKADLSNDEVKSALAHIDTLRTGLVYLSDKHANYDHHVFNLHLSKCYNCKKIAVWVHDRLLFPATKVGVKPNPDLPDDVVSDFEEAREIVNPSPRGAAALLRLCIQKLCKHLGEKGDNLDGDIANLVKKGLNPLVQRSLDIVRVIGNESVHPGVLDLKDDRETALRLFELVNAVADQMISHPKNVNEMYEKLPEHKRKAIEARDAKPGTR
jgi:Domain of unknown function (DUF4145)